MAKIWEHFGRVMKKQWWLGKKMKVAVASSHRGFDLLSLGVGVLIGCFIVSITYLTMHKSDMLSFPSSMFLVFLPFPSFFFLKNCFFFFLHCLDFQWLLRCQQQKMHILWFLSGLVRKMMNVPIVLCLFLMFFCFPAILWCRAQWQAKDFWWVFEQWSCFR